MNYLPAITGSFSIAMWLITEEYFCISSPRADDTSPLVDSLNGQANEGYALSGAGVSIGMDRWIPIRIIHSIGINVLRSEDATELCITELL